MTCGFQQCGILTYVYSDEPVQPPFKIRDSKRCYGSSLNIYRIFKGLAKALITQCVCTGWSVGAQWLSGRELDSRPRGSGFEPQRRHCVVVLEQDTFILA